ncbi:hypothetical protein E1263_19470 [Kribbella antibiotica]|uniref:Uncharacterized protein n=1 Tax=Kribbella antibiotica TaxID=190195 RepID=A0A4R4ZLA2_9ACTN|nr:hypothetical protein [Kribbella antibiotica]TDD58399.1 hypothetical protein E1263_19470 [Kribbella antibiotica]
MHETDLHLDPNEASDLCRVFGPDELARRGWERAFVTVLDEASAENAIALLAHTAGAPLDEGWTAVRVPADAGVHNGRTEDAEACASRDGYVYLVGSQFGKKRGPLSAKRSWIARVSEESIGRALDTGTAAELEVVRMRFGLHRAINDALAGLDLIPLGPLGQASYVDATIAKGELKSWGGTVHVTDHPVNIEAAEFAADGRLLLGLRYPVTADGHPIVVELDNVDELFADANAVPRCGKVWVLDNVGTPEAPAGLRALDTRDGVEFDAIIGDLDAIGKSATVLDDHPEGALADSEHVRFELPAESGPVGTKTMHRFGDIRRIEGIAVDHEGHAHYVIDEEGHVALRTLVFE